MKRGASQKQIRNSVLNGIRAARRLHKRISRRYFGHAPEYLVTCMIARTLAATTGLKVELEASIREIMLGETKKKSTKNASGANGRLDLVLLRKNDLRPCVVVEVKHPLRRSAVSKTTKDVKRVMLALRRSKHRPDVGYVAFYCHSAPGDKTNAKAKERIASDLDELDKEVRALGRKLGCETTRHPTKWQLDEDKIRAPKETRWGMAACIEISRRM